MASVATTRIDPLFSVVFTKGTADRHRLPLSHVLATLTEIDKMIREVGIQIQRANGVERPDGNFGVELIADEGMAFRKGSIRAESAITRDIKNGVQTISKIIEITDTVERKKVISIDEYGEPILRRLNQVSKIQEKDQTTMGLHLVSGGRGKPREAAFSQAGVQALQELHTSELAIQSVVVYGKLKRLTDYSEGDAATHFWGELREDSGKEWRIRFKNHDLSRFQKLFTRQVIVTGDATYFKVEKPRLDARDIQQEKSRDYRAALARFQKNYSGIFRNTDPQEILNDIRG